MSITTGIRLECDFVTRQGNFSVIAKFDVGSGVTALFGPSGSGKSVTLATIAGLVRPSSGSVKLSGVVLADAECGIHVRTQDRDIGMVSQSATLLPFRSPVDNVGIAVRSHKRIVRRNEAKIWLQRVDAAHLADVPISGLSGGEQQRIALARALAGNPRLVLMDEPFSALDRNARVSLRELIRKLANDHQLAILIVTHDREDVMELADCVVLFEPGRTTHTYDLRAEGRAAVPKILGLG
jgi:molybdate transport system ATP-binding protein